MKKIYILLIGCVFCGTVNAQSLSIQNFMRQNPYFSMGNPARHTPYKGYFALPAFSNFNLAVSIPSLRYGEIMRFDEEGYPIAIDMDKLSRNLSPLNNVISMGLNEEILGFGFRTGRLFFSFSARTRVESRIKFSKDLILFPILGNMSFAGEENPARLSARLSLDAYQEFSLGIQMEATRWLSLGIRPKLLIGIAKINTDALDARILTNPSDYSLSLDYHVDLSMVSAMPMRWEQNRIQFDMDYLRRHPEKSLQNLGFSIDLGAVFRINAKMGIALSALDLGFISWETSGIRLQGSLSDAGTFYQGGSFLFDGLTTDQLTQLLKDKESRDEFLDSLLLYFPLEGSTTGKRKLGLTSHLVGEFYYQFNEKHRITAHFSGAFAGKTFYPQFSLAYNMKLLKVLDICALYTLKPKNFAGVGFGLGLDVKPLYFYVGTDDLLGFFNPVISGGVSLQAGLVFKWGKIPEGVPRKKQSSEKSS